ncbi:hypothetical protein Syun_024713 [Stephania yunnanensis]|uniref:Uncharacterized protein n=1 Tax=Stephania yunnanensis TaxID=152371 RepID=A0AAP0EVY0_9MAGN
MFKLHLCRTLHALHSRSQVRMKEEDSDAHFPYRKMVKGFHDNQCRTFVTLHEMDQTHINVGAFPPIDALHRRYNE